MKASIKLDMEGLVRAFSDGARDKYEYVLDLETGTVHFIPLAVLRAVDEGTLNIDELKPQERERAQIAQEYADDLSGRFELVPYIESEAFDEWKQEFLAERGETELTADNSLDWETYRVGRVTEEIDWWIEETELFAGDEDAEDW